MVAMRNRRVGTAATPAQSTKSFVGMGGGAVQRRRVVVGGNEGQVGGDVRVDLGGPTGIEGCWLSCRRTDGLMSRGVLPIDEEWTQVVTYRHGLQGTHSTSRSSALSTWLSSTPGR